MRLIDADELIHSIYEMWDWQSVDGIKSSTVLKQTISDIKNEPTIDAVPVVRCKDCRFYKTHSFQGTEFRLCDFGMPPRADGFCSWAWTGRKEE